MSRQSNADWRTPIRVAATIAVVALASAPHIAAQDVETQRDPAAVAEDYVRQMWSNAEPAWKDRLRQDETQAACSRFRNAPPEDVAAAIMAREAQTIVLPKDGPVLGTWQDGEKVAQSGRGGQFSDTADTVNGGNCYACHEIAKSELSFGTLGPSLAQYGKLHGFSGDAARATFGKIYNPQATVACSNMPRFGAHGFLTEQQIKDVVAYLFDPDSPVNK